MIGADFADAKPARAEVAAAQWEAKIATVVSPLRRLSRGPGAEILVRTEVPASEPSWCQRNSRKICASILATHMRSRHIAKR